MIESFRGNVIRVKNAIKTATWALKGYPIIALEKDPAIDSLRLILKNEILREKILNDIGLFIVSHNIAGDFKVKDLADQILRNILKTEGREVHDLLGSIRSDQMANIWFHLILLSGLTTRWEFLLRKVAERVGIETRIKGDEKTKKRKNLSAPSFRKIEHIIPEIRKTIPSLQVNIEQQLKMRGSAVHANYRELRQIYNSQLAKNLKPNNISSTAYMGKFSNTEIVNIGEIDTNEHVDQTDDYAFFIEILNSKLIENVILEFDKACRDLDIIVTFTAYKELRDKLKYFTSSKKIDQEEKSIIISFLENSPSFRGDSKKFVSAVEFLLTGCPE